MNDHAELPAETQPLSALCLGDRAQVRRIDGGKLMAQRMGMIGIRPGVEVCVVHGPGSRGAVLQVGGAQIALGRGVIDHIRVASVADRQGGRP